MVNSGSVTGVMHVEGAGLCSAHLLTCVQLLHFLGYWLVVDYFISRACQVLVEVLGHRVGNGTS